MKLKKEERLQVGKMLHEGSLSYKECMERYKASMSACWNWASEYSKANGIKSHAPWGLAAAMPARTIRRWRKSGS